MNLFKRMFREKPSVFDEAEALEQEAKDRNRLSYQRIYRVLANAYKYGIEGICAEKEDGLFAVEEYRYQVGELHVYLRYEPSRYAENKSMIHVRITVGGLEEPLVCDDTIEKPMVLTANDYVQWKIDGEWSSQLTDGMRRLGEATYEAYQIQQRDVSQN
ncbi:hypothetical protein [Aneurinibacillus sp. REN35]|uniref:hypothetical protein n=1 Tax=Aneurinibacillus sp. REN35 TaxID=3237286 RepID=UPI0035278658